MKKDSSQIGINVTEPEIYKVIEIEGMRNAYMVTDKEMPTTGSGIRLMQAPLHSKLTVDVLPR